MTNRIEFQKGCPRRQTSDIHTLHNSTKRLFITLLTKLPRVKRKGYLPKYLPSIAEYKSRLGEPIIKAARKSCPASACGSSSNEGYSGSSDEGESGSDTSCSSQKYSDDQPSMASPRDQSNSRSRTVSQGLVLLHSQQCTCVSKTLLFRKCQTGNCNSKQQKDEPQKG